MRHSRSAGWCAAALLAGMAGAQDDAKVALRVVLAADGTPMPGVPVHVAPVAPMHGDAEVVDGWWRQSHWWLRRQRAATTVRSDPDGMVTLVVRKNCEVLAGPPFAGFWSGDAGPSAELRVDRLARFSVRVLGHDGAPLPDFGLQLIAGEMERAVGLTDRNGEAVFGVDPGFGSRLQVVPFGWLGPVDGLPLLPDDRQQKHATLRVPPFGAVRVRALRRGVPVPYAGVVVIEAPRRLPWCVPEAPVAAGVELWPVAVGTTVQGRLLHAEHAQPFVVVGPQRAGEVVVVDVETEPPAQELVFRVDVPDLDPDRTTVAVRVHGELGACFGVARPDAAGNVRMTPEGGNLGERVRRVEVDLERRWPNRVWRAWTACLAVDVPVGDGPVELGLVHLQEWAGCLRGRVVTADGVPVPLADVWFGTDDATLGRLQSGDDGRFEHVGPALRDANGQLRPLRVRAAKGLGTLAVQSEWHECAQGSLVVLTLPPPPVARVLLRLQPAAAVPWHQLRFEFVDAAGRRHRLEFPLAMRSVDQDFVELGPLPAGLGRVCVCLEPGGEVVRSDALTLPTEVRDPVVCTLVLPESAQLRRVRCVNAAGLPIVGAVAVVRAPDGATYRSAGSNTEGWLELAGASAGQVVTVQAPGFAIRPLEAVVDGSVLVFSPR